MKRSVIAVALCAAGLAAGPAVVHADQPPGQLGYEGQPGNQGGGGGSNGGTPNGLKGHEGQPGNQGG